MSDSAAARAQRRRQEELDQFNSDPQRIGQQQLDVWWQGQLDLRAAARRRVERPGAVDTRCGIYDPMRRFENE